MLIKLGGRGLKQLSSAGSDRTFVARICEHAEATEDAAHEVLLRHSAAHEPLPAGFRGYLFRRESEPAATAPPDSYRVSDDFSYLAHGDVVRIDPRRGAVHALYRRSSPSNSFLVTERCDNYCVMCSQPPKEHDDSWIVDELIDQVIPLVSRDTVELGITGGEPSLLGERFIDLVRACKTHLPRTSLHVLSNGRSFASRAFAKALARIEHHDLMLGIPLYGDVPEAHDYVVQQRGAFDQTVRGILNLKEQGVRVELRFVIHADTYSGLPAFARFVVRNLLFIDHIALMQLELMGFARANLDALWIDPLDYQRELREAIDIFDRARMSTSIYNAQLCVLDSELHRFARRSISDWKNAFHDECYGCLLREQCGGFFASSHLRRSRGIARVTG